MKSIPTLGITGSRHWENEERLRAALDAIGTKPKLLVHGGAEGADSMAGRWAEDRHIAQLVFRPNYADLGRLAPLMRNELIVKYADSLIAFRSPGESRGTDFTIRKAREAGKTVRIVHETPECGCPAHGAAGCLWSTDSEGRCPRCFNGACLQ